MLKCWGKRLCMSSTFPIAILNGTVFVAVGRIYSLWKCWEYLLWSEHSLLNYSCLWLCLFHTYASELCGGGNRLLNLLLITEYWICRILNMLHVEHAAYWIYRILNMPHIQYVLYWICCIFNIKYVVYHEWTHRQCAYLWRWRRQVPLSFVTLLICGSYPYCESGAYCSVKGRG